MCRLSGFLLFVLFLISPVAGANLHVDTAGNCNGANPCFTQIQAAVDAASPGDTVVVMPGSYTGCLQVTRPMKLRAFDLQPMSALHQQRQWSIIIAGTNEASCTAVTVTSTEDVTIEGFLLAGGDGVVVRDSRRVTVRDNMIISSWLHISNPYPMLDPRYGVLLSGNVWDSEVTGNYFECQATNLPAIAVRGYDSSATRAGSNTISQNTNFNGCVPAVWILNSDANTLSNNSIHSANRERRIIEGWPAAGIWLRDASANIVQHNDIGSVAAESELNRLNAAVYIDTAMGESAGNVLQVNNLEEVLPATPLGSEGIHIAAGVSATILRNNLIRNWTTPIADLASDTIYIGQRGTN